MLVILKMSKVTNCRNWNHDWNKLFQLLLFLNWWHQWKSRRGEGRARHARHMWRPPGCGGPRTAAQLTQSYIQHCNNSLNAFYLLLYSVRPLRQQEETRSCHFIDNSKGYFICEPQLSNGWNEKRLSGWPSGIDPATIQTEWSVYQWATFSSVRKVGNVLFNDALSTFYLRLYGVGHMVKDHSDCERGNLWLPNGLLFPISSKRCFICTIPQTG